MPIAYLTRTQKISAAHRLHSKCLTDEENKKVFGKCNNPNGHGHNYTFKVTVRGEVDARTGFVLNVCELKDFMEKAIVEPLDHKFIDRDVPYFENVNSTSENLAIFVWEGMEKLLPAGLLYEVKVHETDSNTMVYRGEK